MPLPTTRKTDLLWYGSSTALQSLSSSEKDVVVGDATIVSADNSRLEGAVRLWVEHVCSHCQDDADMLLPHSTSTTDSSFTWTWCCCKTRLCICHLAVGLLQRCAGWTARVNDCTIAARVKFCRSSGARSSTTRSRHCSTDRPTLVTICGMNWVQTLHTGISVGHW